MKKEKPHNAGQWTSARFRSFVMSQLRRGKWPQKYEALKRAYDKTAVNPDTGRQCKWYSCAECSGSFKAKDIRIDHIDPVIPATGFDSWDNVVSRLYCEADNLQALCIECHDIKSKAENAERRKNRS